MGLHIAALFVLLISSGVGVFLPVVFASKKAARGRFSRSVVYVSPFCVQLLESEHD